MSGRSSNYFLGGNTSTGFYSYFDQIISQDDAARIICIKGGPGTGKSSLMKRVGKYYLEKDYDVEFHHCSSDDNSLDGIFIKDLNIALLDGTAPHIVDPANPGAVDEILNMAECLDYSMLKASRQNIISINNSIHNTFSRVYRYLSAASYIYEDWASINYDALNSYELNILKENLKNEILPSFLSCMGKERHLFATGFTPNGIVTYIDSIIKDYDNIYILKGQPGTGKTAVLSYLSSEAVRRGLNVEILHTPLLHEKIEHLLIPELNTAILTCNELTNIEIEGKLFNMDSLLSQNMDEATLLKRSESMDEFFVLLNKALKSLKAAKVLHDKLESYYIPSMDFSLADKMYDQVIENINNYM